MTEPNLFRRHLLMGSGAAVAAAFGGPLTAMAKRPEYRGECSRRSRLADGRQPLRPDRAGQ